MGHNIRYEVYNEKVNRKSVQAEWDEIVRHEDYEEGASGLPGSIRWIDITLPNYDEALKYIEEHDKGWYDQLAVKFKDYSKLKPTKAYESLVEKRVKAIQKVHELEDKFHFEGVKSQYVGCKNCGSKLSLGYLKSNYCPLCRADLRPETMLKRIEKAKENAKTAEQELAKAKKEMEKKQEKSAKVMWLVKVEYHT